MARLAMAGAEGGAVSFDVGGAFQIGPISAISIVASPVHSGSGAFQMDSSSQNFVQMNWTKTPNRWFYSRCWFQTTLIPASGNQHPVAFVYDGTSTLVHTVYVLAGGLLSRDILVGGAPTSAAISANQWNCLQIGTWGDGTSAARLVLRLNGVQFDDFTTSLTPANYGDNVRFGAPNGGWGIYTLDDIALNDETGPEQNSWPGITGKIGLLKPVADHAVGADWALGTGTAPAGTAWDSVNNTPPLGVPNAQAGSDPKQIRNVVSNILGPAADADFRLSAYSTVVPGGSSVRVLQTLAHLAQSSSSATQSAELGFVSPAETRPTVTVPNTIAATYPNNWYGLRGGWIYNPGSLLSDQAVVRLGKRTATTNALLCSALGAYVEYSTGTDHVNLTLTGNAQAGAAASVIAQTFMTMSGNAQAGGGLLLSSRIWPEQPFARFSGQTRVHDLYLRGEDDVSSIAVPGFFAATVVRPTGIASAEAFGAAVLTGGVIPEQFIYPNDVETSFLFGDPRIISAQVLQPPGVVSTESFGIPLVRLGVQVSGIATTEAFGAPSVFTPVHPGGIPTSEQFGFPKLTSILIVTGGPSWPKTQHWTLYLAYSAVIRPGTTDRPPTIAELVYARNTSIEMVLNRPGACRFQIYLDDDRTQLITPVHTCILAVRDGIVRWSGPVWTVEHDIAGGHANVSAVGWLDLLEKRKIRDVVPRPKEDDRDRIEAIFAAMNAQVDTDGTLLPPPLWYVSHEGFERSEFGDNVQLPPKTYERGNPIGSLINELVEVEFGIDITVSPTTREMTSHRSLLVPGSALYGYGVDRPNALFAYGLAPDNLSGITQQVDASTLANVINATGSAGAIRSTDDPHSILIYGAFEEDFSMGDTGVSLETLQIGAAAEVFYRSNPRVTWQATPFPWTPGGNVPRLFDDYNIGDVCRLAAKRSWVRVPARLDEGVVQPVRVFGATINLDDNGDERVTALQFAPS